MDLSTLRRQSAGLFRDLARAEHERWTTPSAGIDLPGIYAPFSALTSHEAFACARDELAHASAEGKSTARALLGLVLTAIEGERAAALDAERLAFESSAKILVEGSPLPFREIPRRLANEPVRELRGRIAKAFEGSLVRLDATLAHRVEASIELADELGFASWEALRAQATGIDFALLASEASATLAATEDAWRDFFDFALRKTVGRISRGEAAPHDLARFSRLAPFDDLFKGRRLFSTTQSFLEAMGLSASADDRIELSDEGVLFPGAAAIALEVPARILVALGRVGGARDFASLFHALGVAHHRAGASRELPVELRRAGEAAAPESFGDLFDQLLCDDAFLRRYLDADGRVAVEAARLCAIERLGRLRRGCADLLYQRTLFVEGPRDDLRGLWREGMAKALLVDAPVERWLWDAAARPNPATGLRALALAEALRRALRDAANEDWWRNPRAGSLIRRIAARGGRDAAETAAKELSGALSLAGAAGRLIEIAAR